MYDVIIVGGGPAGLSAALILGRCRRRVLLCDDGEPRNRHAVHTHGFLTRDGIQPCELLRIGREQLAPYGVEVVHEAITSARRLENGEAGGLATAFEVVAEHGRTFRGRKLLLATGLKDVLPDVAGMKTYYGRGVHHCPYCDGWEYGGRPIAAYGSGHDAVGLALSLTTWSKEVTACTDGMELEARDRERLVRNGISVRTEPVNRLEGDDSPEGVLRRIVFENGPDLPCAALFFNTGHYQHCDLPARLGCAFEPRNEVRTEPRQRTSVRGLYLAGDADGDVQFVVVAAAEGATAAVAINRELQAEDWAA